VVLYSRSDLLLENYVFREVSEHFIESMDFVLVLDASSSSEDWRLEILSEGVACLADARNVSFEAGELISWIERHSQGVVFDLSRSSRAHVYSVGLPVVVCFAVSSNRSECKELLQGAAAGFSQEFVFSTLMLRSDAGVPYPLLIDDSASGKVYGFPSDEPVTLQRLNEFLVQYLAGVLVPRGASPVAAVEGGVLLEFEGGVGLDAAIGKRGGGGVLVVLVCVSWCGACKVYRSVFEGLSVCVGVEYGYVELWSDVLLSIWMSAELPGVYRCEHGQCVAVSLEEAASQCNTKDEL
jgi:hypothetical protein